jgi:hypothetical protein
MSAQAPDGPPRDADAGPEEAAPRAERPRTARELVRTHPWITGILVATTVGGAIAGPFLFEETWPLARQVAAGAFLGAWVGLTMTVTKMFG